jgi:thiol:disulfide interchange protein DsbD
LREKSDLFKRLLPAAILALLTLLPNFLAYAAEQSSLPGQSTTLAAREESSVLDKLRGLTGAAPAGDEFLPPERAFVVEARASGRDTVIVAFKPEPGYYLYRDKIKFEIVSPSKSRIVGQDIPRGEIKNDPNFGDTEVFHHPIETVLHLRPVAADLGTLQILTTYQGCADKGLCYAPIRKILTVAATAASVAGADHNGQHVGTATSEAKPAPLPPDTSVSEEGQLAMLIRNGNLWAMLAVFFGAGMLLTFTPCVFPMIPIVSTIIVGEGSSVTRLRGLILSGTYVLGMAITYALAGVAAGLSGSMISAALQSVWVLGAVAAVFVLLALAMFGFYDLQLPAALQTRLVQTSNRMKGGRMAGVFVMGALSAVIVGPCVTAPLAGALIAISQSREVMRGGAALFSMALGMGVPLIVVGASAGSLLPRAGAWMQSIRNLFGVLLLGMAIWLLAPVIPTTAQMVLWGALFTCSAIFLHALDPLPVNATGWKKLWKGVGVIGLLVGAALLLGALSGGRDLLQPLAGIHLTTSSEARPTAVEFRRIRSTAELDEAIRSAAGKRVMLDFYADWCISCKEMERFTFSDAEVRGRLSRMVLLQADVTQNNQQDAALLKRFGLFGPPGIIFFAGNGVEASGAARVVGFKTPKEFLAVLDQLDSKR